MSVGGTMQLAMEQGERVSLANGPLPQERFALLGISIRQDKTEIKDGDWARLQGCRRLQSLLLGGTSINGSGLASLARV